LAQRYFAGDCLLRQYWRYCYLDGLRPQRLVGGLICDTQGIEVGFAQWMRWGCGCWWLMLLLSVVVADRVDFGIGRADDSSEMIRRELEALGPLGRG